MFISNQKKFIFLHIPKTGGTTVKSIIKDYIDINKFNIEGELVTKIGKYSSHPVPNFIFKSKYPDHFSFAFVRNPWEWHASYYLFIKRRKNCYDHIDFNQYVILLCSDKLDYCHKHILSDWTHDNNNNQKVDFIGRFENLENDIKYLCDKLDIPISDEIGHYKKAPDYDYHNMYNEHTKELIRKRHQRDIELFNYEF